jgi:hypothetical protein
MFLLFLSTSERPGELTRSLVTRRLLFRRDDGIDGAWKVSQQGEPVIVEA